MPNNSSPHQRTSSNSEALDSLLDSMEKDGDDVSDMITTAQHAERDLRKVSPWVIGESLLHRIPMLSADCGFPH